MTAFNGLSEKDAPVPFEQTCEKLTSNFPKNNQVSFPLVIGEG